MDVRILRTIRRGILRKCQDDPARYFALLRAGDGVKHGGSPAKGKRAVGPKGACVAEPDGAAYCGGRKGKVSRGGAETRKEEKPSEKSI